MSDELPERLKKLKAEAAKFQAEHERKFRERPADKVGSLGRMSRADADWLHGGLDPEGQKRFEQEIEKDKKRYKYRH